MSAFEIPAINSYEQWLLKDKTLETRYEYILTQGWCIVTQEVAEILGAFLKGKQVIEVFAGRGYLAHQLREAAGLDHRSYRAYDNHSSYGTDWHYPGVMKKNAFRAPIRKADVIVMSWPPYGTNHAERIVKKMVPGQMLVFNGELRGCTGNDAFAQYVEDRFVHHESLTEKLNDVHVQFEYMRDCWSIFEKTQ